MYRSIRVGNGTGTMHFGVGPFGRVYDFPGRFDPGSCGRTPPFDSNDLFLSGHGNTPPRKKDNLSPAKSRGKRTFPQGETTDPIGTAKSRQRPRRGIFTLLSSIPGGDFDACIDQRRNSGFHRYISNVFSTSAGAGSYCSGSIEQPARHLAKAAHRARITEQFSERSVRFDRVILPRYRSARNRRPPLLQIADEIPSNLPASGCRAS